MNHENDEKFDFDKTQGGFWLDKHFRQLEMQVEKTAYRCWKHGFITGALSAFSGFIAGVILYELIF